MYHPKFDGRLVLEEDMGTYAPRVHQRIIAKLTSGLGWLYQRDKTIRLEPLPETMVDEAQASPTPDLILVDPVTELIHVVIEVCHSGGLKKDIQKIIDLLDGGLYDIQEGFIYNYKTGQWYRYRAATGGVMDESSFSDVLQLDLNTLLQD